MKSDFRRVLAALLAAILAVTVFAGCNGVDTEKKEIAADFDGEQISLEEARMYIYNFQYDMEMSNQFSIQYFYNGSVEEFWKADTGQNVTNWEYGRSSAMKRVYQTKLLVKEAARRGISLNDEEKKKVEKTIAEFPEKYAKIAEFSKASDETIRKFFEENALANKVYLDIVKDVDRTVDEAKFRRVNAAAMHISVYDHEMTDGELSNTGYGDGTTEEGYEKKEYTEEERKEFLDITTKDVKAKLLAGKEIDDIVASYKNNRSVLVESYGVFEVGEDDAAPEGEEPDSYKELAWTLKTGEVGTLDVSKEDTVQSFVILCKNDDDPNLKKDAIDAEIASREEEIFKVQFPGIQDRYAKYQVFEDALLGILYRGELFEVPVEESSTEAAEAEKE